MSPLLTTYPFGVPAAQKCSHCHPPFTSFKATCWKFFTPPTQSIDLIVSNPPYVGESEADKLQIEVRQHEPHAALFGAKEGLDVYRRLIPRAHKVLKPKGWLVTEIGY